MPAASRENEAKLSAEQLHSILDYDPKSGLFHWKQSFGVNAKEGNIAGYVRPDGRRQIKIGYIRYLASRLAWLYVYGEWPGLFVDHIDRDKSNDAISNLRQATARQNHWNSGVKRHNSLGLRNITRHKKRFAVRIYQDKQAIYRQSFATLEEAMAARNAQLAVFFGAFTPTSPDN